MNDICYNSLIESYDYHVYIIFLELLWFLILKKRSRPRLDCKN